MCNSLEEAVVRASPGELILMLYDRALRDLAGARDLFLLQGDPRAPADAIHQVVHAQQIVAELNHCVNKDSGDLAVNLSRIYEYIQYRLVEAVAVRNEASLKEALELLTELRNTWAQLVEKQKKG
jgi:flagellar protein FliS